MTRSRNRETFTLKDKYTLLCSWVHNPLLAAQKNLHMLHQKHEGMVFFQPSKWGTLYTNKGHRGHVHTTFQRVSGIWRKQTTLFLWLIVRAPVLHSGDLKAVITWFEVSEAWLSHYLKHICFLNFCTEINKQFKKMQSFFLSGKICARLHMSMDWMWLHTFSIFFREVKIL